MKDMFRCIAPLVLAVTAASANAAVIATAPVQIDAIRVYLNQGVDYNIEVRITNASYATAFPSGASCAATATPNPNPGTLGGHIFTYFTGADLNWPVQLLSDIEYADAQGRLVVLTYESTQCDATRGFKLLGVQILPGT